jgi:putative DNA primase/helicase
MSTTLFPSEVKQNTFKSFDDFKKFVRDAFINDSGIDPDLFDACIEFHEDLEFDDGHEASYPIHEELNWKKIRFGRKATEPFYAALLKNEDGTTWQAILSLWDESKNRPYKYLAPTGNGDRVFLPPVPPLIRKRITSRYGVDVPIEGSFWKWLETQDKLPRILTEGGKKGLAGLSLGYVTLALYGCSSGAPAKDKEGQRIAPKPIPDLSRFAIEHTIWLFALDRDEKESAKTAVSFGKKRLAVALQKETSKCFCEDIFWKPDQGKGLDDLVVKSGSGAFDGAYNRALQRLEKQFSKDGLIIQSKNETAKKPPADKIAQKIADDYKQLLKFDNEAGRWMRYEADFPGTWSQETDDFIQSIVYKILVSEGIEGFDANYVSSTTKLLKNELIERKWEEVSPVQFLPFRNGVLELSTGKLLRHSPQYRFTWQLPREYSVVSGVWNKIDAFLTHLAADNQEIKNLLICFANAVIKGRCDLQKFLHLIGLGGTGKGSYGRLLISLIGRQNVHSTTMDEWCQNRFEPANAYGKRLVVFADEDKQTGKLGKFLSLTGQDELRSEEKNKKAFPYRYEGMVLVMSNFPIFMGDSASRVKRRVITVPCNNPVAQVNSKLEVELEAELAAFTNYLLSLSDEYVTKTLDGVKDISLCTLEFWENRMRVDSIAAWLNQHVIYDVTATIAIGSDRLEGEDGANLQTLFGSYNRYLRKAGGNATSHKNFSPNLLELCQSILGWTVRRQVAKTGKYVQGLRLRIAGDDDDIPTYDYILMQQVASEAVDNAKKIISADIAIQPSPLPKAIQDMHPEPSPEPSPLPSPLPSPDKKAEKICSNAVVAESDNSELKSEQSTGDGRGDGSGDGSESLPNKESDGCDGSTAISAEIFLNQSRGFQIPTVKVKFASPLGDVKAIATPAANGQYSFHLIYPGDKQDELITQNCSNDETATKFIKKRVGNWKKGLKFSVQQLGEDDYIWIENCKCISIPDVRAHRLQWVFDTPAGDRIWVTGDNEFRLMS